MSSKQVKVNRQEELETILKKIEKIPPNDIRQLFKVSQISKLNFIDGILEFSEGEQKEFVDLILQDPVLNFLLQEQLSNWEQMPYDSRHAVLDTMYDILDAELRTTRKKIKDSSAAGQKEAIKLWTLTTVDLCRELIRNSTQFEKLQQTKDKAISEFIIVNDMLIAKMKNEKDTIEKDTIEKEAELVSKIRSLQEKLSFFCEHIVLNRQELFKVAEKATKSTIENHILENNSVVAKTN